MRRAWGEVWPLRILKMVSQRKRMPAVAMPTTEAEKRNRVRRRKRT
jgi:hypothetical protein